MTGYTGRGLHGQVVDELGARIVSGRLGRDASIDLGRLEAELDVSRTMLREALKVLAAKGLIDARQKRGTYVLPREQWNLLDADVLRWQLSARPTGELLGSLAEVRAIVEPAGARLAAARRDDADVAALSEALAAMTSESTVDIVAADLRFHRALLAASHNELLARMAAVTEAGPATRGALVHGGDAPVECPVPAHRAVFDAVEAGDRDAAEQTMRALLDQAERDTEALRRTRETG